MSLCRTKRKLLLFIVRTASSQWDGYFDLNKKKNNNRMRCCCCVLWAQREGRPDAGLGARCNEKAARRSPPWGPGGGSSCSCPRLARRCSEASRTAGGGPGGDWAPRGGRGWVAAPPGGSRPGGKCRGPPGSRARSRHCAPSTTVPRASRLKPAGQVGRLRLSGKPATLGWRQFGGLPPVVRFARASCSLCFASGGAWCQPRAESAVPSCIFGRCTRALPVLFPHADPSAPGVSPACHSGQVPGADRGPVTGHPRRCPQSGCAT